MPCGEASNTYFLCQHLARVPGLETHLLTTRQRSGARLSGVFVHDTMARWSWREVPRLLSIARRVRPDWVLLVFIGGIYSEHPMITFAPTLVRRVVPGARFVTRFEWVAGAAPHRTGLVSRVMRKAVAALCKGGADYEFGTLIAASDHIVSLSETQREQICARDPSARGRVTVIPPASNIPVVHDPNGSLRVAGRRHAGVGPDDFVLGYLGYLYPSKGVETLLRACGEVRRRVTNVRLIVVGGPGGAVLEQGVAYHRDLQQLAASLGIADAVVWLGERSVLDPLFSSLVHAADAWVLPFDRGIQMNNSSFASLAAYGVPLITTRGENHDPELVDRANVLLCPPRDPVALASAIELVRSDREASTRIARGLANFATDRLSWDTALSRVLSVLEAQP
jgi:glycosyltransferase involved in cell wall biosynthesis